MKCYSISFKIIDLELIINEIVMNKITSAFLYEMSQLKNFKSQEESQLQIKISAAINHFKDSYSEIPLKPLKKFARFIQKWGSTEQKKQFKKASNLFYRLIYDKKNSSSEINKKKRQAQDYLELSRNKRIKTEEQNINPLSLMDLPAEMIDMFFDKIDFGMMIHLTTVNKFLNEWRDRYVIKQLDKIRSEEYASFVSKYVKKIIEKSPEKITTLLLDEKFDITFKDLQNCTNLVSLNIQRGANCLFNATQFDMSGVNSPFTLTNLTVINCKSSDFSNFPQIKNFRAEQTTVDFDMLSKDLESLDICFRSIPKNNNLNISNFTKLIRLRTDIPFNGTPVSSLQTFVLGNYTTKGNPLKFDNYEFLGHLTKLSNLQLIYCNFLEVDLPHLPKNLKILKIENNCNLETHFTKEELWGNLPSQLTYLKLVVYEENSLDLEGISCLTKLEALEAINLSWKNDTIFPNSLTSLTDYCCGINNENKYKEFNPDLFTKNIEKINLIHYKLNETCYSTPKNKNLILDCCVLKKLTLPIPTQIPIINCDILFANPH